MIQTKIRELNKSIEAKREQLKQFQADKINFKNELSRQVTCERKYLLSEFLKDKSNFKTCAVWREKKCPMVRQLLFE